MDMQQQQWQPQQLQTHPPPTVIFPGQKYHTTCGVVIAKAYWDCAPPPVSGQEPKQLGDLDPKPQNQPSGCSGGTNLETLDVETRVVVANAYRNLVPPQPQAQPQLESTPKAQPNAQVLSVGAQQAINRKRKAALERVENKRVATMLKAPVCRRKTEGEVLFAISEMIGCPETWPAGIRDIFFLRKLNRTNRLNIITFTLGNWMAYHHMPCTNGQP